MNDEVLHRILLEGDRDGLRLIGLSRIPRCARCDRFAALRTAWEARARLDSPLPPVPDDCHHVCCEPLTQRLGGVDEVPPARLARHERLRSGASATEARAFHEAPVN